MEKYLLLCYNRKNKQENIHKHQELLILDNDVQLRRVDADFYTNVSEEDVAKQSNMFSNCEIELKFRRYK